MCLICFRKADLIRYVGKKLDAELVLSRKFYQVTKLLMPLADTDQRRSMNEDSVLQEAVVSAE